MYNEFWAQVKEIKTIAKDTSEVIFEFTDTTFHFLPGQYVWIVLPRLTFPDEQGEQRAFSITSSILRKNEITIQFRNSESGYKKTLLSYKKGVTVKIRGPFGCSYVLGDNQKKIVMIAGGIGIAPFLSILRSWEQHSLKPGCSLIYVNVSFDRSVYLDELTNITTRYYIPFIKHIGNFTVNLLMQSIDFANDHFYICGPMGFVESVYKVLLAKGVSFEQIHFEQFYPQSEGNLTKSDFILKPGEENIMFQAIQDSKNHVIITDANGVVVFANKTAQKNTGYTLGEMYGNTPRLWGGLMSADFYQNFWRKKHEVKGYEGQLTNRRKNGELYTVIVHISPITNKNGALVGYIGTEEDITQIVSLKNQLSQDKKRDEALLRSLGEGVVAQDENGKVTFVNKAGLDMLGYSLHELLGKSFVHIVRADSPKTENRLTELERPLFQARVTKQPVRAELIYYRKDGSIFESEVIITPVYTEEKYYGDIQVFKDITKEKEIDKAKTEFVSLASHQLRTPLTAIKWYSKMLLTEDRGKITEKQKEYLDEIHDGNEKMVSLVNTLLNVSRIELGTFVIAPQQVQVISICEDVLGEVQEGILAKNIQLLKNFSPLSDISADPNYLRIIFQNLITNAIKYTPPKGVITITISQKGKSILITIRDTGYGIPEKDKKKIFTKLFRADNVVRKDTEGTGLGLYITKAVVEKAAGGKIWFESFENSGTTFFVLLPTEGMKERKGVNTLI